MKKFVLNADRILAEFSGPISLDLTEAIYRPDLGVQAREQQGVFWILDSLVGFPKVHELCHGLGPICHDVELVVLGVPSQGEVGFAP